MTALLPLATWDLPPPHPEALLDAGNLILRWGSGVGWDANAKLDHNR